MKRSASTTNDFWGEAMEPDGWFYAFCIGFLGFAITVVPKALRMTVIAGACALLL
jgi:hypothetical protein